MDDYVIETQTDETIEEVETSETPDATDDVEDDKAEDSTTDDTTSDESEDEYFVGTFKTKEEAENGILNAQQKITEQGKKIAELEKKFEATKNPPVNPSMRMQEVGRQLQAQYNEIYEGLGYKYSSYIPSDVQITDVNDIINNLPSDKAAQFMAELKDIQNDYAVNFKQKTDAIIAEEQKRFEDQKNADKERYKDNELVFNAWYEPPATIEEVFELVEKVKQKAIEDYIKEQATKQEDEKHKNKLNTSVNGKAKFKEDHIFTREEIDKMSDREFAKYEDKISQQVAAGLVE